MRQLPPALVLLAILAFGACGDPPDPTAPATASETAVELIMAELSDARTLEVSAAFHGQTIDERLDHLTGLLQWFADQQDVAFDDTVTTPKIDTAFTVIALEVSTPDFPWEPETPEMMSGKIIVYTKATVTGAIAHRIDWDYGSYTDEFKVPKHLRYEELDVIAGDELLTEVGCFYLPNETNLPNERVDYWAYAETRHVYTVGNPVIYTEEWNTSDLEDTRHPTPPTFLITPCAEGGGF